MNIADYLHKDAVLPELASTDMDGVLGELTGSLEKLYPELASVDPVRILQEREAMGSTAVGEGIAIPHGKVSGLPTVVLAVGRSLDGVECNAPDGRPCHVFFLILAPEHGAGPHLRLLAQIARRVKDPVYRSELLLAQTRDQLWQTLSAP